MKKIKWYYHIQTDPNSGEDVLTDAGIVAEDLTLLLFKLKIIKEFSII